MLLAKNTPPLIVTVPVVTTKIFHPVFVESFAILRERIVCVVAAEFGAAKFILPTYAYAPVTKLKSYKSIGMLPAEFQLQTSYCYL
jgi:hypothetical protein